MVTPRFLGVVTSKFFHTQLPSKCIGTKQDLLFALQNLSATVHQPYHTEDNVYFSKRFKFHLKLREGRCLLDHLSFAPVATALVRTDKYLIARSQRVTFFEWLPVFLCFSVNSILLWFHRRPLVFKFIFCFIITVRDHFVIRLRILLKCRF